MKTLKKLIYNSVYLINVMYNVNKYQKNIPNYKLMLSLLFLLLTISKVAHWFCLFYESLKPSYPDANELLNNINCAIRNG